MNSKSILSPMKGIEKIRLKDRQTISGQFLVFTPLSLIIYFIIVVFGSLAFTGNIFVVSFIGRYQLSTQVISLLIIGLITALFAISYSKKDRTLKEGGSRTKAELIIIHQTNFSIVLPIARTMLILALFGNLISILIQPDLWFSKPTTGIKLQTIPGVTTLTQVAPLAIALLFIGKKIRVISPLETNLMYLLLILTTWRAFVNSERLALFEVAIPIAILQLYHSRNNLWRKYKNLGLPFYLVASFLIFTAQEFYRSWPFYRDSFDGNFAQFSMARFISYYSSSIRNGIFLLSEKDASLAYSNLLNFLYNFPILGELFRPSFEQVTWLGFLNSKFGSAEFNTANSFLVLAANYGVFGLIIFIYIIFRVVRNLFIKISDGDLVSLAIYAILIPGYLELARLNWFTLGRTLPLLIFSFLTYKYYNRKVTTK